MFQSITYFETRHNAVFVRLDLRLAKYAVEMFLNDINVPNAPAFSQEMVREAVCF